MIRRSAPWLGVPLRDRFLLVDRLSSVSRVGSAVNNGTIGRATLQIAIVLVCGLTPALFSFGCMNCVFVSLTIWHGQRILVP